MSNTSPSALCPSVPAVKAFQNKHKELFSIIVKVGTMPVKSFQNLIFALIKPVLVSAILIPAACKRPLLMVPQVLGQADRI
ncbi:hypothetical protein [Angelakisella massiliensis]|uniref:hypothetical protein n=1 Tax=Angelakisella massiliensis TaxID=1871018 RepID=UPI0024B15E8C|nr:hypothetical protein [Angelakisella massiliensis]